MSKQAMTRWTIVVSKDTDIALRSHLAHYGTKKGDISRFVEDAVKWRVLECTIAEARAKFADMAPEALQTLIDEATQSVRNSAD